MLRIRHELILFEITCNRLKVIKVLALAKSAIRNNLGAELNEIKQLFNDYINYNIKNYNIKGITFYPQFSNTKIIYIFDKQDDKYKSELIGGTANINLIGETNNQEDSFDYSDKKRIFKFELVNPECIDDIVLNLEMLKTLTPDVYKLFGIFVILYSILLNISNKYCSYFNSPVNSLVSTSLYFSHE